MRRALIVAAFLLSLGATQAAVAQSGPCGSVAEILNVLTKTWGERPIALGIGGQGQWTVEIFLNPQTRTFSIIQRARQGGVACLVADGEEFEPLPLDKPEQDNPS